MSKCYPDTVPEAYTKHADLEDAYRRGWNHGHGLACNNVPSIGDRIDRTVDFDGLGDRVDAENIHRYHELLCFAGESNSRDFSPFEFTAHYFNEHPTEPLDDDDTPISEEMWEAFEAGTTDSIFADLAEYDDEAYGIEDEEPDQDEDEEPGA